jgi:Flp pilus assembly protein TadG
MRGSASLPPERPRPDHRSRGQSLVEFALVLPVLAIMLLAIVDLSRVFTSMMTVESAAREAADYGAWQSVNWQGDPTDTDSNRYKTEAGMRARACTASNNLVGFEGSLSDCTNPAIAIDVLDENDVSAIGTGGLVTSDCDQAQRTSGSVELDPCRVKVDLTYDFDLIVPVGIDFFGSRLGLPQEVSFTRSSVFAISDFDLDS